ncbi:transporter substrate-binding domain-containing protein [Tissierella praeacuta]|uniref:transporter substrate-binding domain-containing protein n=1 Tax=Tissierella praeacuta TaxID=43131 RepID=UPI00333F9633
MIRKRILSIFLCSIILLYFSLPSNAITLQDISKEPLKIGGDNNYPPYEFVDDNDNFRGFNVDIIRAIAIELGLEIELIPNSWEDTMEILKNGEVDAIQGMTVTPERSKIYDFTQEIVMNSQNIFVLKNSSIIHNINDLSGKRVSIQSEDVSKEITRRISDVTVIPKTNQLEALQSLLSGEVDAYVGNRLTGIYYVQTLGLTESVKIVGEPLYSTKYSIAVKKGNKELLNLLDSGLEAIKLNGTYDKIYKKWFGETILDINQKWINLLSMSLVALSISLIIIYIVYYWNKTLKKEVEIRTKEIIELNNLAMHNDKMQALGKLSSGIAHELRNPLTSINAFVDLIPLKIDDENFRKELMKIVPSEIKRLNDLVSSLLDYSKPKNPKPEKIMLSEILPDVLTLLKQKFREKKIKVITQNIDICLYADESQIKQILINILLNSIDAIDNNGQIDIEGDIVNIKASISIKDNGSGIPEEMLDKLFDPFYSSKKTGYGIGLSVTERLIKENNGDIKLESKDGQGTIATIYIPTEPPCRKEK